MPAHTTGSQRGGLVVISAPSGGGKTTIARQVMIAFPSLSFSVSATTRPKREGETDGKDYFFLAKEEFRRRVEAGEFVEWEEIYGNLYGTLKCEVDRALGEGRNILFDVDVKGGLSIKKHYPGSLLIFIRPPSLAVLEQRLRDRHTEDSSALERRLSRVPMELELGGKFDHQIVNDALSHAVAEVQSIIRGYLDGH